MGACQAHLLGHLRHFAVKIAVVGGIINGGESLIVVLERF